MRSGTGYFPLSQCLTDLSETPNRRASHSPGIPRCSRSVLNSAAVSIVFSRCCRTTRSQREKKGGGQPRRRPPRAIPSAPGDGRVHRVSGVLPLLSNDLPAGRLQQLLGGGDGAGGGVVGVHVHAGVGLVDDPVAEAVDGGFLVVLD